MIDPITGAITAAGILHGILSGRQAGPSVGSINRKYLNMPITGALSADDYGFADRSLQRSLGTIRGNVATGTRSALRSSTQRGVGGAALQQTLADIEGGGNVAAEGATRDNADLLFGIREGNKGREFDRQQTAWGAELGDLQQKRQVSAAKNGAFWNSFMGFAPTLFSHLNSVPTSSGPTTGQLIDMTGSSVGDLTKPGPVQPRGF